MYGQLSSKLTFGEFFAIFSRATARHEDQYKQQSRQEEIRDGNSKRGSTICVAKPWSNVYRVAKTHRMPYLYRSISAEEPYNYWCFCEK